MSADRELLRATFDTVAARYEQARPDYPGELFDELVGLTGVRPPGRLLEVGCGTGKATEPLARRGFAITAVELGSALAGEARERLRGFPLVCVINSAFEGWDPVGWGGFDLVYAATAWKWVDPGVKYGRAAAVLRQGGYLATWAAGHAFPEGVDPVFAEIQEVYDEIGEGRHRPEPRDRNDATAAEFEDSGCFEVTATRQYLWALSYTADAYIALLDTFSHHIAMRADKRDYLYRQIRERLAGRPDGRLIRHWCATLTVGRRL